MPAFSGKAYCIVRELLTRGELLAAADASSESSAELSSSAESSDVAVFHFRECLLIWRAQIEQQSSKALSQSLGQSHITGGTVSENKMQVQDSCHSFYGCAGTTTLQTQPFTVCRALLTQQCQVEHIISRGKSPADHK